MIRRFSLFCLNIVWKTVAVIVVGSAVFVSVVRLWLPSIDQHREEIAAWISRQVNQPVEFDRIAANWQGWTPVIELTDFRLKDKTNTHILTRFETARLAIDLARSFRRQELTPGALMVSGVRISIVRGDDGTIRVEGIAPQETQVSSLYQNALAYWLQMQRQLTIESASITWRDQKLLFKPLVFSDVSLQIRSDGERRQLEGRARLPQSPDSRFRFLLDARGDLLTPVWSGEMYIEGTAIEPSMLLEYSRWMGLEVAGGKLDFKAWTDWKNARLTGVTGTVAAQGVDVGTHARRVRLDTVSGTIAARRETPESWYLALEDLNVATPTGAWPESAIALALTKPDEQELQTLAVRASFLRIEDVAAILGDIPALPETVRTALAQLQPRGDLRDLRVGYFPQRTGAERFNLRARAAGLSTAAVGRFPGVEGLAGELAADPTAGVLHLDSEAIRLDTGRLEQPVSIDRATGTLRWRHDEQGWTFATDALQIANADLSALIAGTVEWSAEGAPRVNLRAAFGEGRLDRLPAYLPAGVLPAKGESWVRQALRDGRIAGGGAVLRGPLNRFPFDDYDGRFEVRVNVAGATLAYAQRWPAVEGIDAEVVFSGRSLTVAAEHGRTLSAELGATRAYVRDLTAPKRVVVVEGQARASAAQARQYIIESPLKDHLAKLLEATADTGKVALDLKLQVPLYPDLSQFQGSLHLDGASLHAPHTDIEATDVMGDVSFTRGEFSAADLKGKYLGRPVHLAIGGTMKGGQVASELAMSGHTDLTFLRDRLQALAPAVASWMDRLHLFHRIEGETDWRAELSAGADADGAPVQRLRIGTSLEGLALNLPAPLDKATDAVEPFAIGTVLSDAPVRDFEFSLGDALQGTLTVRKVSAGESEVENAVIRLGREASPPPQFRGLWVGGAVGLVSVSEWSNLFHDTVTVDPQSASSVPPLPVAIDLHANRIEVLGRWLDDVALQGSSGADRWTFNVNGRQIEGQVTVPHRLAGGTAQVDLQRLDVPPRTEEIERKVQLNPAHVPAVAARCERLRFEDIDFGRAELTTHPTADGLQLERLTFESPSSTIAADGLWELREDIHTSRFNIQVRAAELSRLLTQFNYDVTPVEGGDTTLGIAASWGGTPAEFTLDKLSGSLTMEIRDGRFLDIKNPATGRLFGLLSIQALPRRLLLDFNDLFKRGLAFDRIGGTFELDRGNAYTNNLTMDGSSARIEITGRTGLAGKDYDQLVTVTPQVSDSLPVASALFGPAGAGVGAAIFLGKTLFKELPEQLDKMLSRQYTITGRWNDPVIEQTRGIDLSPGEG